MYPYLVAFASNNAPGIAPRRAKAALSRVPIEGFTVADVILVVGKRLKIYSECMGKIVILMLDNWRKLDQF